MMRTLLLSAALIAGLATSLAAQPLPGSGAYYLPYCQSLAANSAAAPVADTLESLDCAINLDDLAGMGRMLPAESRFCKPAEVTIPQMADAAVAYIKAHADRQAESFMVLAGNALHEKWPCR
jgi:hypothetical protein